MTQQQESPRLARQLSTSDAVVIGLGSMLGAGVFTVFGPAASAARGGLLTALAVAAIVASCNAASSARLAARYPESGGTYVYGRERLGEWFGYIAGWAFVTGKVSSAAAIALTFAAYAVPGAHRFVHVILAIALVVALEAANFSGVRKTVALTRVVVCLVLIGLGVFVAAALTRAHPVGRVELGLSPLGGPGLHGLLQGAALLFFAFAGYARMATLGEEVRDPSRAIPRAIATALAITVVLYTAVALAALTSLGLPHLAATATPLADAARGTLPHADIAIRIAATVATAGVLLSLLAGIDRTALAMARRHDLPHRLAAVHPVRQVPHRATMVVAVAVSALVAVVGANAAIALSSSTVLIYYAIANASALTLPGGRRDWRHLSAVVGLAGCLALVANLPARQLLAGLTVLLAGVLARLLSRRVPNRRAAALRTE